MGLLDQLWDDTVAGPRPDSGLGKLRNDDAQGRGLEEAAPERQDGRRRRRRPRHAEEPHRLRLGGDQLAGPVNDSQLKGGSEHKGHVHPLSEVLTMVFLCFVYVKITPTFL
ncbi:uncharacterized protein LOC120660755 isoform X2 [Panicum virgatum]|uniref:uncharacterized protein LOC120660755 isoform X2 n=1 Tax=Panicum virgatum TaxID=38727 RepID=UPI0019D580F2|nr:uncharacterized protein LOC120660755 isoform X2 [Panicum virgatum]